MTYAALYTGPSTLIDFNHVREMLMPRFRTRPRVMLTEAIEIQEGWRPVAETRLAKLSTYSVGWDGYQSEPPRRTVIEFARSVLDSTMQPTTATPAIVPLNGGGLQLEWHIGGLDIELAIYRPNEAELTVSYSDGREPIEERALTSNFADLAHALKELA
jgi:hypothetical protein